ncbi:hypothetical protein BH09PSE5_BH09PSE5_40680 [soil metagenome]
MNQTATVDADYVPPMNTEMRDAPPFVDDYDGPLKAACIRLCSQLEHREIDVDTFQARTRDLLLDPSTLTELRALTDKALVERKDQVMYREQKGNLRITLQLLYVAPREVHPPHAHHNLISNQMTVHGRCYVREYDRVARIDERTLLLRLAHDDWSNVGDLMQTTESIRNAHWFAADDEPCVVLNFYLLGYQSWTFDPLGAVKRRGRQCVDPTSESQEDGLIVARELELADGYKIFGGKPLTDFPAIPPMRRPAAASV